MLSEDSEHRRWAENEISDCLDRYEYAPIIFAGSGISQRYIDAPGWGGLLEDLITECPNIDKPIGYYEEEYTKPQIGTQLVDPFRNWAWEDKGTHDYFDPELWDQDGKEKYLKHRVAKYFRKLSPDSVEEIDSEWQSEIEALQRMSPSAIITTNYDFLLERIFSGFSPMVGQEIYKKSNKKVGDLFKIHGCASEEQSLVITEEDYENFDKRKKYISAKLLTYFTEHPVLIVGHSASDDNVQDILSDINMMLPSDQGDLIDNIFLLNRLKDSDDPTQLPREEVIEVDKRQSVRVRSIKAKSYEWVYDAFSSGNPMDEAEIEQIREFASKIYNVTTKDAPRKKVNFQRLEYFSDEENISKLLGFVPIDNEETVEGLKQAGIPIGEGEITTEAVSEINKRLNTATKDWKSNVDLANSRELVLTFRNEIKNLNLSNRKCEFLFRSSQMVRLQGVDWLIEYEGNLEPLFERSIEEDSKAKAVKRLQFTLAILGKKPLLEKVHEKYAERFDLKTNNLLDAIDEPIENIINLYGTSENILFVDGSCPASELVGNKERTNRILDSATDVLIEEEKTGNKKPQNAVDFRKLELIKLANHFVID